MAEDVSASNASDAVDYEKLTPGFLDILYGTLFHPVDLFRWVASPSGEALTSRLLTYGAAVVVGVSAISPMLVFAGHGGKVEGLAFQVPIRVMFGLFLWVGMSGLMSMMAKAFRGEGEGRFKTLMTLTAYAAAPWVLLAPLTLIKYGMEGTGAFLGVTGGLLVWLWTVLLFALAVAQTYRLPMDRLIVVLLMPFAMAWVGFAWVIGFFLKIERLLP